MKRVNVIAPEFSALFAAISFSAQAETKTVALSVKATTDAGFPSILKN